MYFIGVFIRYCACWRQLLCTAYWKIMDLSTKNNKGLKFWKENYKKTLGLFFFFLFSKDTSPATVCIDPNTDYSAESYWVTVAAQSMKTRLRTAWKIPQKWLWEPCWMLNSVKITKLFNCSKSSSDALLKHRLDTGVINSVKSVILCFIFLFVFTLAVLVL